MKKIISIKILLLILTLNCYSQEETIRVLFLGNSYTYVNNLPQIITDLSAETDKTFIYEINTPGGCTLETHSTNTTSLEKIRKGNWDYVVLQEQSQIPTIDYYRYGSMYPAVERLNDSIKKYNPCANVVTFMTWGRRYGGMQCDDGGVHCSPDFVDFSHMQDSLESAYVEISINVDAYIAPVGIAWKKVIENSETILHSGDDSHPNINGSYLAACVFYSVFWKESPIDNPYTADLTADLALYLQEAADDIVFHSEFDWNMFIDYPLADYSYTIDNNTVEFTNLSTGFEPITYFWDFGDENTSNDENPIHTYTETQTYSVSLIAQHCTRTDTIIKSVTIISTNLNEKTNKFDFSIYPNPFYENIIIESKTNYKNCQIQIFNLLGQIIYKTEFTTQKKILSLSHLSSGIYILKISNRVNGFKNEYKIEKK